MSSPSNASDHRFLRRAIDLAVDNVMSENGGPFGALVVHKGEIIAEATNVVTRSNDPTAHAEVMAIRKACDALDTFQLTNCTLYTSCEPCPMCMGAVYWARLERVVYGALHSDAARVGFDDSHIYDELRSAPHDRKLPMEQHLHDYAQRPFHAWADADGRVEY